MSKSLAALWKGATHLQVCRISIVLAVLMLILLLSAWLLSNTVYAATTVTVNDVGDASDLLQGGGICDADNAAGEQCTLRAAIQELNAQGADSTPHQIHFNIPGSGSHIIAPESNLPNISVPMIIDGSTQPGATCPTADQPANLQIVLDGINNAELASRGIWVSSGVGSTIRGLAIGNFYTGIWLTASDNQIECSHIGLGADGVTPMPNSTGIRVTSSDNNTIGGTESHVQRNVISANTSIGADVGVSFLDGNNVIANNYIGTTADGLNPLGNEVGVLLQQSASTDVGNSLGGTSPLARNVISGNERYGVQILAGQNHQVLGNFIGVGVDGVTAVPNQWDGILITTQSADNIIGGIAPGEANLIAHNGDSGIAIFDDNAITGNTLRGNVLVGNGNPGIDIGLDDVDENDVLDGDEGGNGRLNYPVLTTVSASGQIIGSYSGAANQTFTLDFYASAQCHESGHGEGEMYLGSTAVTTDSNGEAVFDILVGSLANQSVSATATDADGSTSEFSACVYVDGTPPPPPPLPFITNCVDADTPPINYDEAVYLPLVVSNSSAQLANAKLSVANNTLTDGGVVTGVDGVSIGAIAGTLPTSIDVAIAAATAPTQTIITDPTIHGSYYHIAADQDVIICGQEKGFILGLPIPDGVSNANLAIASLSEGSEDWAIRTGLYDDQSDLMLVRLFGLSLDGMTVVLIESPNFDSLPETAVSTQLYVANETGSNDNFYVHCFAGSGECPDVNLIAQFLELVYIELSDMGYPNPNINCRGDLISINPPEYDCEHPAKYQVFAVSPDVNLSGCFTGYDPNGDYFSTFQFGGEGRLFICPTTVSQLFNIDKRAIRFHYFLAAQYGFPEHHRTWLDWTQGDVRYNHNDWVPVSTATAAMISVPTVMESTNDYDRRPVDVPLASDEPPYKYQAQDFWVYAGKQLDEGLTMLEPLFEQHGATTNAVVDWAGGMENFQNLYWNWAQNQVMLEDGILLNDDDSGTACTFQENSAETLLTVHYSAGGIAYDLPSNTPALQPLTTVVYQFTIDANLRPAILFAGGVKLRDEGIRAKIYVNGEAGCELMEDEDGTRSFSESEWDDIIVSGTEIYIVVSNTDTENEHEISFGVEAAPYSPPAP